VPVLDETTEGVTRAQAALAEVAQRQQADAERAAHEAEEEGRRADLTRWHHEAGDVDEQTAEAVDSTEAVGEPVLER
jgi:hypothetical protein